MPAGYKTLNKEQVQITNNNDPNHFKTYEQRQMRTDDIQGAVPKNYGYQVPSEVMAGAPTGNSKIRN